MLSGGVAAVQEEEALVAATTAQPKPDQGKEGKNPRKRRFLLADGNRQSSGGATTAGTNPWVVAGLC